VIACDTPHQFLPVISVVHSFPVWLSAAQQFELYVCLLSSKLFEIKLFQCSAQFSASALNIQQQTGNENEKKKSRGHT